MAIEFKGVSKSYGGVQALRGVDLCIGGEKIYGLLGSNGAGKTTLLSLMGDRQPPTQGQVLIDGAPVQGNDEALAKTFIVGEENFFPEDMKVKGAFEAAALFYPAFDRQRAAALAEKFGLDTKKKIRSLSTGYSSIFKLVLGLCVGVPYLAFDEPVLGLDARHRDLFYKLLLETYAQRPCTILLSTHLIEEAANLIEHTVILSRGRVLRDCTSEELRGGAYAVSGPAAMVEEYLRGKTVLSISAVGGLRTASVQGQPTGELPPGLELSPLNLQEYFISLIEEEEQRGQAI